ncbi:hypothetical protein Rs2_16241 [Raphanus sativus]|nr:hypothetical protein Rs2_16241 [Raphanus sativus]
MKVTCGLFPTIKYPSYNTYLFILFFTSSPEHNCFFSSSFSIEVFAVSSGGGMQVALSAQNLKLPYQHKTSGLKVVFSRIMYRIAPSTVSSSSWSQPQPSIRLTSRTLKIAKSYNVEDVPEGFTANLSSTLEKLYKEVKDEEKLRVIYEEKCRTLKKLDNLGAESSKIDTT